MMMFETEEESNKFEELYKTYRNYMYWTIYKIIKDEHEAEDVLHNAFIKISKIVNRIDTENEEKTKMFMATIARNTAIDCYRKKQKLRGVEERETLDNQTDWNRVENNFIDKYNYQCLVKKIEALPEKYKDALRLRCLYGLSIKETAEQLSISENNAYARVCRAKRMLLAAIENKEECEDLQ